MQLTINGNDSSIYRDLAMVYTNENWFVIPFVVGILGTEFPKYLTLVRKTAQLRTILHCWKLFGLFNVNSLDCNKGAFVVTSIQNH